MVKQIRRLFDQFRPDNYILELELNPSQMTFSGRVTILGKKVGKPSQRLTFHQKGLVVTKAKINKIQKNTSEVIELNRINCQDSFDEVRLHTKDLIYPGVYSVEMEFKGTIDKQMNGIYPSYIKHAKTKSLLIATQFESHHAREAFPCIDEPEAKATFDLGIITPDNQTIISNTPLRSQTLKEDKYTTLFSTTPRMSTYLLAFVYGDLEYLEGKTKDGVMVRTYASKHNVKFTEFALSCAIKTLEYYNDYFGIDYPLDKCDLIALPDFASGAMENWGCITFREQALLVDPKNTSLFSKQYVALVVAHELAHMWFGNLVTMRWWTDLWLNEGFASWIEYLAVDKLFPEWDVWTQFIVDEQEQGLKPDSLHNTHAVEAPINHPDEIRTIFDNISYQKGSCVINMLHRYLGAENFKNGLRNYLKTNAYGNTDTVDLWAALEEVSHKPVKKFMHAWTSQAGFPIVHVKTGNQSIALKQERFFLDPINKHDSTIWPIDLEPSLACFKESTDIFDSKELKLTLIDKNGNLPIINHNRTGYYRIAYDADYLEYLSNQIKNGTIGPIDRLGILSDSCEAAKSGHLGSVEVLKLLNVYSEEDSAVVWDIIASLIGNIRMVMDDEDLRVAMRPFIIKLVDKEFTRLGWDKNEDESYFDSLLRPTILGLAASAHQPDVVKKATTLFNKATSPDSIHPDLRPIVFATIARHGNKNDFDKLMGMYKTTISSEDKVTLSGALTNFRQKELIKEALAVITTDTVRTQDVGYWLAYSFMNSSAKHLTWEWMKLNWDWLTNNLGSDLSFYRFPNYAARAFSDDNFLPEFKEFFSTRMSQAFERPVAQGVETIEWQAAWRKRDHEKIIKFFEDYKAG